MKQRASKQTGQVFSAFFFPLVITIVLLMLLTRWGQLSARAEGLAAPSGAVVFSEIAWTTPKAARLEKI